MMSVCMNKSTNTMFLPACMAFSVAFYGTRHHLLISFLNLPDLKINNTYSNFVISVLNPAL